MIARCLVGGCVWTHTGDEPERAEAIEAHRLAAHPWVRPGRLTNVSDLTVAPDGEE